MELVQKPPAIRGECFQGLVKTNCPSIAGKIPRRSEKQRLTVNRFLLYTQYVKRIPVRFWDFLSVIILVIAQTVVCQRLFITGWTSGLSLSVVLDFLGIVLGLSLGISRFKSAVTTLLVLGYSLFLIPLSAGAMLNDQTPWLERLSNLAGRLVNSFGLFVARQPVPDTLLFVVFISVVFWIVSLTAGYALTRSGNYLGAVLPGGIVLFIIQLYDPVSPGRAAFLAVYLFLCLLLLGRVTYARKRSFWQEQKVWISSESVTDLNISILLASLGLVFVTWGMPASGQPVEAAKHLWEDLTRPFQNTRSNLGNAITGLQGQTAASANNLYAADLALGQEAGRGTNLVFTVQVPLNQNVARYYWSVRTYDQYLDGEWHTTTDYERAFSPSQQLNAADSIGLLTSQFVFTLAQQNISTLITPPRPVWVSRPATLTYLPAQDGEVDPILFEVSPPLQSGQSYTIHASLLNPSVVQLRQAGTVYPAWVSNYYLQLPSGLPPVIPALAQQITASAQTPFDAAQAITEYLRSNIRYNDSIPSAPAGEDPLVWFLFEYKQGFCNYYASAEVILLRSIGIPARLAVGYAEGEYQPPDRRLILERDAHAWPEVYFPGIGWVEFEPTVSQAPLERPSGILASAPGKAAATQEAGAGKISTGPNATASPLESSPSVGTPVNSLLWVTILVIVVFIFIIATWLVLMFGPETQISLRVRGVFQKPAPLIILDTLDKFSLAPPRWLERLAFRARRTPIERSFGIVMRSLRWLDAEPTPAQTPAEAAAKLSVLLPAAAENIRTLLDEYQNAVYSQEPGDWATARRAAKSLRRQSLRAAISKRYFRITQ